MGRGLNLPFLPIAKDACLPASCASTVRKQHGSTNGRGPLGCRTVQSFRASKGTCIPLDKTEGKSDSMSTQFLGWQGDTPAII